MVYNCCDGLHTDKYQWNSFVAAPTAAIFVAMACSSRHLSTLVHHILLLKPLTWR